MAVVRGFECDIVRNIEVECRNGTLSDGSALNVGREMGVACVSICRGTFGCGPLHALKMRGQEQAAATSSFAQTASQGS